MLSNLSVYSEDLYFIFIVSIQVSSFFVCLLQVVLLWSSRNDFWTLKLHSNHSKMKFSLRIVSYLDKTLEYDLKSLICASQERICLQHQFLHEAYWFFSPASGASNLPSLTDVCLMAAAPLRLRGGTDRYWVQTRRMWKQKWGSLNRAEGERSPIWPHWKHTVTPQSPQREAQGNLFLMSELYNEFWTVCSCACVCVCVCVCVCACMSVDIEMFDMCLPVCTCVCLQLQTMYRLLLRVWCMLTALLPDQTHTHTHT